MGLRRNPPALLRTLEFQMAATALTTIRSPEPRHEDCARRCLIQRAFGQVRTPHRRHRHPRRGEQVIDMPAQGLLAPQMPADARLESVFGGTRVDVIPRRESELAEAADSQVQGVGEVDLELVGAWRSHRSVRP
jgi:hypothetical protein